MNLPFDNCGIYTDLWKIISQDLNNFRENKKPEDGIDSVERSVRVILKRYLKIFNIISKKVLPLSDFFNELESNREYHSRQLYVLRKTTKSDLIPILNPHVDSFNEDNLETLDKILFKANKELNEPYECIWILNHTMMFLADWEIKNNSGLFKQDFLKGIIEENVSSLPSNLRMLSRVIAKDKNKVLQMYPFSFLMNYSYFYPVHLYHTGKEPTGPVPAAPVPTASAPAASAPDASTPAAPDASAPDASAAASAPAVASAASAVPDAPVTSPEASDPRIPEGPLGPNSETSNFLKKFYKKMYGEKEKLLKLTLTDDMTISDEISRIRETLNYRSGYMYAYENPIYKDYMSLDKDASKQKQELERIKLVNKDIYKVYNELHDKYPSFIRKPDEVRNSLEQTTDLSIIQTKLSSKRTSMSNEI
jgi:hypothetical protein